MATDAKRTACVANFHVAKLNDIDHAWLFMNNIDHAWLFMNIIQTCKVCILNTW